MSAGLWIFLAHLLQKDQESLLEKSYFKDSSPGRDFGFLLGLETCTFLKSCQDHLFWDLHIWEVVHSSLQSKRLVCDLKPKFPLKLSAWQNKLLLPDNQKSELFHIQLCSD